MLDRISTDGLVVGSVSVEADAKVPSSPYSSLAFTGRAVFISTINFLKELATTLG